ncbi:hypothetical protein [Microcoleus sp. D2_18a_B4]|uniref:hypothetical protein n=1 Tax=Microcoleus sp. D2_18a_B4 TaxID=3055329 RepID=UPI002FD5FF85
MALDTRSDRILWGIGNLVIGALAIPFCYGLSSKDFASFKFLSAAVGVGAGINSVRLFYEHEQGAGVRSAWRTSAEMVSAAWIEEIAMTNSPPSFRPPVHQLTKEEEDFMYAQYLRERARYKPEQKDFSEILVEHSVSVPPPTEDLPDRGDSRQYGKMPGISWYPSLLIYGIPGAGKTTFVEEEIQKRLATGHEVIVLDPHASYGQWEGCEVVGDGMDYKAIDAKITWFKNEVERRYKIRRSQKNPKFAPLTILTEEFTNWADRCKYSGEHFKTVNSDIRKVECYSIIVTHTRTLAGLGDAKGMASLRDESMLEVEILGDYDPVTERATPRFEALVKMPGQALGDRTLVKIEKKSEEVLPVPVSSPGTPQRKPEKPGTPDGIRVERFSGLLAEILAETAPAVFSVEFPLEHEDRLQLAQLVIAENLGTEKTILLLWGVRRGGRNHHLYVEAKAMLDRLIEQIKAEGDTI